MPQVLYNVIEDAMYIEENTSSHHFALFQILEWRQIQ